MTSFIVVILATIIFIAVMIVCTEIVSMFINWQTEEQTTLKYQMGKTLKKLMGYLKRIYLLVLLLFIVGCAGLSTTEKDIREQGIWAEVPK